jgi:hypothetical protein
VDYLHESGVSIYRRRRQRRAVATFVCVIALLVGTLVYAASYVQGWVGAPAPKVVGNASCSSTAALAPKDVTVNVYNATIQPGLAAAVARLLEVQGFQIATIDNDPLGKSLDNVGEIRHGQSGTAGALLMKKRLPRARVVNDGRADASVDVVVGKAYKRLQFPPKVAVSKGTVTPGC